MLHKKLSLLFSFGVMQDVCCIKYNKLSVPDHFAIEDEMLKQVLFCTVNSGVLLSCLDGFCGLLEFLKWLIVVIDKASQKPFVSLFSN